jgi:hypothetical protein
MTIHADTPAQISLAHIVKALETDGDPSFTPLLRVAHKLLDQAKKDPAMMVESMETHERTTKQEVKVVFEKTQLQAIYESIHELLCDKTPSDVPGESVEARQARAITAMIEFMIFSRAFKGKSGEPKA